MKDKKKNQKEKGKSSDKGKSKKIAAIRIRGTLGLKKDIKETLNMLNLYKNNYCVVLDRKPSTIGMFKKVQNYVTWGEIDEETLKLLEKEQGNKKPFYRLHPPRKGFERKGIKIHYSAGGALGYRGKKINDLIKRMLPSKPKKENKK